jgi:uncharacterized paraquat-inducible protein A
MSTLIKFKTFLKSLAFHFWAGFPKSTQEEINTRFSICQNCDTFDNKSSQCLACGCNLSTKRIFMNKLAWADQKCPLDKWQKIDRNSR